MVGAGVKIFRVELSIDWMRWTARERSDQLRMCRPNRTCGLFRRFARDQLANCRKNALSLGHGSSPWLGLGPVASANLPSACSVVALWPRFCQYKTHKNE